LLSAVTGSVHAQGFSPLAAAIQVPFTVKPGVMQPAAANEVLVNTPASSQVVCFNKAGFNYLAPNATIQGPDNGGSTIDKLTASTANVTSATLLSMVTAAGGASFSSGSQLAFDPDTFDVLVVDRAGNLEEDLTTEGFLTISLDPNFDGVWQGQLNLKTGAASYTGTYLTIISFNDNHGNTLNVSGITTEQVSVTAINKRGNQTVTDSLSFIGSGDGSLGGNGATYTGITFSGSSKVVEPAS